MSSTDTALRAYDMRPQRSESLYDLAKHYREKGMNETSLLFSRQGLKMPYPTEDLLFIEDAVYQWGFREEFAICAFYSSDPEEKARGRAICDGLALDRSVPQHVRDLARRNSHFYLQPIREVLPSWRTRRLTFAPPDGYHQMAPSVTRYGKRIVAAQRCINYWIDEGGYNTAAGRISDTAKIHTRTLLLDIDPDTLQESVRGEIVMPNLPVDPNALILGFEDMRLFEWGDELWGLSTVLDQNPHGYAEQWLARIGSDLQMHDARALIPDGPRQTREKNWMPLVDDGVLRFVYLCDPTRIVDQGGHTFCESIPSIAADHFRGGSQAIPFDGGYLAVVHFVTWLDGWPKYRHRFAWFDKDYKLAATSLGWVFPSQALPELLRGYQYVTGLCWHPDNQRLIMGFQMDERESHLGSFNADDVRGLLNWERAVATLPVQSYPSVVPSLRSRGQDTMTRDERINYYRDQMWGRMAGWMQQPICHVIAAVGAIQERHQVCGDIVEFGVYHGKFVLLLDTLRELGERTIAVDLFEMQELSPHDPEPYRENLARFKDNIGLAPWHPQIEIVQRDTLSFPKDHFAGVKIFSIDAAHTPINAFNDLVIAQEALVPGGIIAFDDFYHPVWTGATEGFYKFMYQANRRLKPLLYYKNKLFLTTASEHQFLLPEYRDLLMPLEPRAEMASLCGYEFIVMSWDGL